MITLFDQEYAVDAYAREVAQEAAEKGREEGIEEGEIKATIEMCQEFGLNIIKTFDKVAERFGITREEAAVYIDKYWVIKE